MVESFTKNIKFLGDWLKLFVAVLIICTAILILLGRQTIGGLDHLRPDIQSFIADSTGMQVKLGKLSGQWESLFPDLEIESFQILDADNDTVIHINKGRACLDFINTIRHQVPIWRELTIEDLVIDFTEDANGQWNLKGIAGQSDSDLDLITKPFTYSRFIRLQSVEINLQSFSGNTSHFFASDMLVENEADFRRAQLSLSLNKEDIPARLIVEAQGDPADLDSFYAEGYLKFDKLNFSKQILDFAKSSMPELFAKLSISQLETAGEIWIDVHPGGGFDFEGQLAMSSLPLNWLADIPPITDMQAQITGWYTPSLNWGVRLQDFVFNWSSINLKQNMMFSQNLASNAKEFDLTINRLDLDLLSRLFLKSQIVEPHKLDFIEESEMRGNLSLITLGKGASGYHASANVEALHMQSYKGVPGMKGVDGYLEMNEGQGFFHISDTDGFELFFPKQYRDYQRFDGAKGTINLVWSADKDQMIVRSDAIATQFPGGEGNIMFSVERLLSSRDQAPEFTMLVAGKDLDASYGSNLLPYKMPVSLSSWLKTSIKEGNVEEFAMLFRGGPPRKSVTSRTTQLMFKTKDATIKYHPDWPQLDNMDAIVLIDDGNLDSQINSAQLGDMSVTQGLLEYDRTVTADQRKLIIDVSASADVSHAINVLANSPLREKLGILSQWRYKGKSNTQMHLEIPLTPGLSTTDYRVTSVIDNADLLVTGSPIEINALSGSLSFSPDAGLTSDNLSATLWQKPLTATAYKANKQQKISFETTVSPQSLNKFVDFPWAQIISGDLPIEGTLDINLSDKPTKLLITSPMEGVALNLPEPFGKSAEETLALDMQFVFEPKLSRFQGSLGDLLRADFYYANRQFKKGMVTYDRLPVSLENDQLLVAVHLPTIEIDIWRHLIDTLQISQKNNASTWQTVFDLEFDYLRVAGLDLKGINTQIRALRKGLSVTLDSDLASGQITMPWDKQQVPIIDLASLKLPKNSFQQTSQYQQVDPRQFTSVDFAVKQLRVEDQLLGSLSFELRPEPSGAAFNNISGDLLGVQPGVFDSEAPMEFFWGYDGTQHMSKLVGPLGVTNFADFMGGLSIPKFLDSESGKLDLNLSWQAEPWAISKETIQGDFRVNLRDGSFYRSSGGAGATLKLISLFNFANWLRRLQLDFSDVVGRNLAYNRLDGFLNFNQGVLSLNEPLKIDMPSGKMSMGGKFDLVRETVDAKLVATLPVGVNLPWLVGLAGGLPAAAGVFITSKLAQKQVDRLSSISYILNGPWDDIEVSVDKIFAAELSNNSSSQQ